MTLADAQRFIDVARRVYPPSYDINGSGRTWPLFTPIEFKWLGDNCVVGASTKPDFSEAEKLIGRTNERGLRFAPISAHWRALLEPLKIAGPGEAEVKPDSTVWRHVVDDRIPVMSFVSLTDAGSRFGLCQSSAQVAKINDYGERTRAAAEAARADLRLVSRGDWLRICYADGPGDDPMPYAPDFFRSFEKDACYDRYFPSDATTTSTRYMFTGYHFSMVGSGDYYDSTAVHHFRRHYFQIGLVLIMEFALLLKTSSRMSTAVDRLKRTDEGRKAEAEEMFQREWLAIKEDFLQFIHLYRFTDLSNQIQASEMFKRWRNAMGLDQVFADVKAELDTASEFLIAKDQNRQAAAATRLTLIAAIFATLGLAFSFLGANVLFTDKVLLEALNGGKGLALIARHLTVIFGVVAAFGILSFTIPYLIPKLFGNRQERDQAAFRKIAGWTAIISAGFATICWRIGWNELWHALIGFY